MPRAGTVRGIKFICAAAICLVLMPGGVRSDESALETAKHAFEKGDYSRAIEILKSAAASQPNNGDIYVLLTRAYLELSVRCRGEQRGKSRGDRSEEFRLSPMAWGSVRREGGPRFDAERLFAGAQDAEGI